MGTPPPPAEVLGRALETLTSARLALMGLFAFVHGAILRGRRRSTRWPHVSHAPGLL